MTEFEFPPVHVTEVVDVGDHREERAVTPEVCDFCFDVRVAWDYNCADFDIPHLNFGSMGGWATCGHCAYLIEGDEWQKLLERTCRSWEMRFSYLPSAQVIALQEIQEAFQSNYTGRQPHREGE